MPGLPFMISKCVPLTPETLLYYYSHFIDKETGALSQVPTLTQLPGGRMEISLKKWWVRHDQRMFSSSVVFQHSTNDVGISSCQPSRVFLELEYDLMILKSPRF